MHISLFSAKFLFSSEATGFFFRFDRIDDIFNDYNVLVKRCAELDPRVPSDNVKVTHIHAIDASITGYGWRHFNGLDGIQEVRFVRCGNLHDFGLEYMAKAVGSHLGYLEIDSCRRVTEFGLAHLEKCSALKSLLLSNLKHVHGHDKVLQRLKKALPNTEIHFPAR
ncbi:hypothetical protein OESDEN_14361 [Oesophagostomum dentatum]|uniref:Uncharacterized protein n=1 Tax=Oesophagostomum dentatum TaxID=61180 RepID=A0A0B1SQU7_OESDE|nr:hypothetical protein OESDEN_14361 [Oesophagostomum dentatum]